MRVRAARNPKCRAGLKVYPGTNDIQAGIAAVTARLRTGRLKVRRAGCPNLLHEAQLYRYPENRAGQGVSEVPIDDFNHALAALRYLVSKLDAGFMARFRKKPGSTPEAEPSSSPAGPPSARRSVYLDQPKPWTPFDA
ncbi:MAG TPA: hypothetical protein VFA18_15370 [Gemmataceae bacterium]|nr:hypothetical protein [Gemmataceae bacterium]